MHERLLSQLLMARTVVQHTARAMALMRAVGALLMGGRLALTDLGRSMSGVGHEKHRIKAVDRLLGNRHLHRERDQIYRAVAAKLLAGNARPVIVVDWSDFELGRKWLMLKAALPVGGRAISLYERVFPFKRYNSPSAHREFLASLKSILPEDCRPILVTDAGFRGPWFRAVEQQGWDWVGRIRNKIKFYREETGRWCFTDSLYKLAKPTPTFVGDVALSRRHRYHFRLYLVRAHKPRVGRPPRRGPKKPNTSMYRRLHKAPWLLATSLPQQAGTPKRVQRLYALRMQIEETFRDLKSHRFGFALRYARAQSAARLEILLLLGTLATLVVWLAGLAAKAQQWDRHLQANTERRRAVLSVFFVGRQIFRLRMDLPLKLIDDALLTLRAALVV